MTVQVRLKAGIVTALASAALAAPAGAQSGPCTEASKDAFRDGGGHVHSDPAQHRFSCRMRQVFYDSLADELAARPDIVLGEMDVKADLAVIGVTYPEAGFLLYDVSNPASPVFRSWFRSDECDQFLFDVNCGSFVDLSADGKTVFLSIQAFAPFPIGRGTGGRQPTSAPGVQVVDISQPAEPRLVQTYPVVSEGGVHTTRSQVIPADAPGPGPRDAGEYLFSIANGVGIDIARIERSGGAVNLVPWNTITVGSVHDTFIQNDPIEGRTYLYVSGGFQTGFYVFDVTDPGSVSEIGQWDLTPQCPEDWYSHTIDVRVENGRRFLTMPSEMLVLGEQLEEDQAEGCGRTWGNGDQPGPLWIVDITNLAALARIDDQQDTVKQKSEPLLVTTWTNAAGRQGGNLVFSPHNQQIVGDLIYLSDYHAGVQVLDASAAFAGRHERPVEVGFAVPSEPAARPVYTTPVPPAQPFFSDNLDVRPNVWDMTFWKGHVIAPDMVGGLHVFKPEEAVRLRLRLRCVRGRLRASISGADARQVKRVDFSLGRKRVARDRRSPFAARIRARKGRRVVVRAAIVLKDGRKTTLRARGRGC